MSNFLLDHQVKIDKGFDSVVESDYILYALPYSKLQEIAKLWYGPNFDFSNFDNRHIRGEYDEAQVIEMKKTGLLCNLFFAYVEDDKYYLLDGFNRLFTNYAEINLDQIVYLKVLTSKLEDHQLMSTMFKLNLWKLYSSGYTHSGFRINDFLDRGFKLLLKSKFDIEFYKFPDYKNNADWYEKRTHDKEDLDVLEHYFVHESEMTADFKYSYHHVGRLLSNPNVINDFRNIIKANDYKEKPFNNYHLFLNGYMYYLSLMRLKGDDRNIFTLDYFLEKLYADEKFFKKLQGMSGNDSTRKNIYKFFRELNLEQDGKE